MISRNIHWEQYWIGQWSQRESDMFFSGCLYSMTDNTVSAVNSIIIAIHNNISGSQWSLNNWNSRWSSSTCSQPFDQRRRRHNCGRALNSISNTILYTFPRTIGGLALDLLPHDHRMFYHRMPKKILLSLWMSEFGGKWWNIVHLMQSFQDQFTGPSIPLE